MGMDQYGREAFLSPTAGTFKAPSESYQGLLPSPTIPVHRQPQIPERENEGPEKKSASWSQPSTNGGLNAPLSGWPQLTNEEKTIPCEIAEGVHVRLPGLNH